MNDIIIIGDDAQGIADIKCCLQNHFQTKDLESLRAFLGIEVTRCTKGITLFQRKYVLDISDISLLGCRAANALIEDNVNLLPDQEEILDDRGRY